MYFVIGKQITAAKLDSLATVIFKADFYKNNKYVTLGVAK